MTENELLGKTLKLARELLRGAVVFKHADAMTTGVPDVSVTLHAVTSWWEFKLSTDGRIEGTGLQLLTMQRLAAAGHAHYVVFEDVRGVKRTLIVNPQDVQRDGRYLDAVWTPKWDHRFVVRSMGEVHGV